MLLFDCVCLFACYLHVVVVCGLVWFGVTIRLEWLVDSCQLVVSTLCLLACWLVGLIGGCCYLWYSVGVFGGFAVWFVRCDCDLLIMSCWLFVLFTLCCWCWLIGWLVLCLNGLSLLDGLLLGLLMFDWYLVCLVYRFALGVAELAVWVGEVCLGCLVC